MTASLAEMYRETDIGPVAALLADSARAAMLVALLDDRPLAAGELARLAGVSPATASAHLTRLLHGGLVTVQSQGRHRYYRLAGSDVAAAIEALAHLSPTVPVRSLRQSRHAAALASARTCYDHLAGRAGVALLDALLARGFLVRVPARAPHTGPAHVRPLHTVPAHVRPALTGPAHTGPAATGPAPTGPAHTGPAHTSPAALHLTAAGDAGLAAFGINMDTLRRSRRRLMGECLDWTERRPHLNGALGAALTARLLGLGWIERGAHRRAVRVTPAGRDGLATTFGWSLQD